MKYDKLNRLSEKVYPDNTKESYEYDACGNLTKNTAVNGATTTYEYNSINKNISNTDAYGNVTKFTYDDMGRHVSTIDPLGNQISFEYDGNGNITKTTFADGSYVTSTYDARDRVTEQVDANGNKTSYTYDGADRLIEVVDALGGKTTYDYDQNGSLIRVTDALGHVTSYTYDSLGRVTCTENALGNKATNKYDETGKLVEATTYSGIKTIYTYDELDRVVEELTGDDSIKYTYDADGKITKVAKNGKEATFSYNEYGQLTSKTDENNITISYTYNEYGQIVKSNNGFSDTSYEYDLLGRVTRVIDKNGKATVYEYDANGNKTAVKYPNGTVMSYTYDACNRLKEEALTNASGKQLAKYVYSHGKSGEKTKVEETDEQGNKITTTYAYDKLNRLVKETIEGADGSLTNTYEYDSVSNRTKKTTTKTGDISKLADTKSNSDQLETGETTYVYNAVNQLMAEKAPNGTIEYIYDADGNLVKQTGLKNAVYTYDAYGKLATAEIKKADKTTKESYTYDYNGNRISKTTDGKTVNYVVDESYTYTKVVAEYNSQGEVTADYTIGDDIISATIDGKVCYYVYDGHGDVRYLVDEKGTFTDKYSYDAYGVLLRKVGDTNNEFLYCGEQYNESTGLYYLRARYMNPGTGTFISMDSYAGNISDPVSLHKYLYANANPIMYTDPSGYSALGSAIDEIGAAMISASYEVSYVAYVALLASIFVMATVTIVGTACGMSPDEIRTLAFEFVKQIGIFAFLTALTILAVYSPILAALSLAIGCTFLTIGTFELYVSLKEGDYKRAALMGILLILGFKGVVGEVNALKAGEASIKSGGKIAVKSGYQASDSNQLSALIDGNSYDINKLKRTQPYTYPDNVASIKECIIKNGPNSVPPIEIRVHDGQAIVVEGHHRLEAFRQLGYDRVPIKYLHSSQLGKTLADGTYYRTIEELLDAIISN